MADELGRGCIGPNLNQLVPRTNEFNRGREVAPIAEITLPDGNAIKGLFMFNLVLRITH